MTDRAFFYKETNGIRITVHPVYLNEQSQPLMNRYIFAYFIRIENVSKKKVQLLSRRWLIHDSGGEDQHVEGDGVVGEQPTITPGGVHEYNSFCVLTTGSGFMEGSYRFIGSDDVLFDAIIPRFQLRAEGQ